MSSTITPSRIRHLEERVEKWDAAVDGEEQEMDRLSNELRQFMQPRRAPRGRHLTQQRRLAERRRATALARLREAQTALEEARMQRAVEQGGTEQALESLRIDTVLAQQALANGDETLLRYYLDRLPKWAAMARGEGR
jgi:hypothetical protein